MSTINEFPLPGLVQKSESASKSLPLAPESAAWDGAGARSRIAKWASSDGSGDKDKIDWPKYAKAFAYFDSSQKEDFGGYKLPFADVIGGELKAVWNGVKAAYGATQGARTPMTISDAEKSAAVAVLLSYYKKFGKDLPGTKKSEDFPFPGAVNKAWSDSARQASAEARRGSNSEREDEKYNTGAQRARDGNYGVGDRVKISSNVSGPKTGKVVGFDKDGSYAKVRAGGEVSTYHNSDLTKIG